MLRWYQGFSTFGELSSVERQEIIPTFFHPFKAFLHQVFSLLMNPNEEASSCQVKEPRLFMNSREDKTGSEALQQLLQTQN